MSTLRVTCKGAQTLPLDRIEEFQGNLKKLSKKNLEKLKKRIIEDGFNVPFFVWDHEGMYKALDGHQRIKALCSLREEGWDIPLLPVAFIEASDEADARKKLLAISSQYGEFDSSELSEWLDEIGGEVAETLRLTDKPLPMDNAQQEESQSDSEKDEDPKAFSVVVWCSDAEEQMKTVERLLSLGYTAQTLDMSVKQKRKK